MASLSDDRLRELAQAVRDALERADKRRWLETLRLFPCGACGDSELLVAKLLQDHGHQPAFDYMLGRRDGWSHAWIQQGDLIVDITADQFDDYAEPVTVVRGPAWHEGFSPERRHVADLDLINPPWIKQGLRSAYSQVVDSLPPDLRPPHQTMSADL